ncbi:hypothetical protein [Thalassomonas haliotis]|uniref:MSHA biogenesis protein MshJ n=1 Tax=Thalassomonas haliotis TaxID=485448 RepID=A0ABY7VCV5_9GAMM|nr:hypothetical protein [Thalassomonas haliotis]WDE10959.1 hypothetical protein H3N35_22375 [Thalassomonas haliotis]
MQQWQELSEKFLSLSPREQLLILLTGTVLIVFTFFTLAIDNNLVAARNLQQQKQQLASSNKGLAQSVTGLQQALKRDPNVALKLQLEQYEQELLAADQQLLALTSDLIDPVEMRYALIDLLAMQPEIKLLSFELLPPAELISAPPTQELAGQEPATPALTTELNSKQANAVEVKNDVGLKAMTLYRHGIKLRLRGRYFQLRDYLAQMENLSWRFFWQDFDYRLVEYPSSELEVEIYSLSTKRAFLGV